MKRSHEVIVKVDHVKKTFKIPHERYSSLKQNALHLFSQRRFSIFRAIQDVSFEVHRGEFFSIIGQNGSGKSTLLKILAGIYRPSSGSVMINGRLSPFIELGVGFNPELTARENIFVNGAILGLTRKEIEDCFDEIIAFAELEDFVDQKLKNFSSGMLVRLAFSVAIRAHADVMLIDEVLAVGDSNFQQKCFDVFRSLKAQGKTIIFVSHDLGSVKEFSDRVLVLNKGRDYGIFSPDKAVMIYSEINQETTSQSFQDREDEQEARRATSEPTVTKVDLKNAAGKSVRALAMNDAATVELTISNPKNLKLVAGVSIVRNDGLYCFGTNTSIDKTPLKDGVTTVSIDYDKLRLQKGSYYLIVGLFSPNINQTYDMQEHVLDFGVSQIEDYGGVTYIDHTWRQN